MTAKRAAPGYADLACRLGLEAPLAHDPKWSAAPDFLALLAEHVELTRPDTILECSSGASTVVLAAACRMQGQGHVHSLENGPEFAAATRRELARHGLATWATVLDAPLIPITLEGRAFQWYETAALPPAPIQMLVIDGPPGFLQPHSRYPALPRLMDRLAPACTVLLDDAARPDEQELVALWLTRHPDFRLDYIHTDRGCARLTRP